LVLPCVVTMTRVLPEHLLGVGVWSGRAIMRCPSLMVTCICGFLSGLCPSTGSGRGLTAVNRESTRSARMVAKLCSFGRFDFVGGDQRFSYGGFSQPLVGVVVLRSCL